MTILYTAVLALLLDFTPISQCFLDSSAITSKEAEIGLTDVARQGNFSIVYSYAMKGCLSEMSRSMIRNVIMLSDGTRILISPDLKLAKTPYANGWFYKYQPAEKYYPRQFGSLPRNISSIRTSVVDGVVIEKWIGVWNDGKGSLAATFTTSKSTSSTPVTIFRTPRRISNLTVFASSTDGPSVNISYLTEIEMGEREAVTAYWNPALVP